MSYLVGSEVGESSQLGIRGFGTGFARSPIGLGKRCFPVCDYPVWRCVSGPVTPTVGGKEDWKDFETDREERERRVSC